MADDDVTPRLLLLKTKPAKPEPVDAVVTALREAYSAATRGVLRSVVIVGSCGTGVSYQDMAFADDGNPHEMLGGLDHAHALILRGCLDADDAADADASDDSGENPHDPPDTDAN